MKLYVGNLPPEVVEQDLQTLFAQAGTVKSIQIVMDQDTGLSRGFGFVQMASRAEGEAVIIQLNGAEVGGYRLTISEAPPRENRGSFVASRRGGPSHGWSGN